MNAEELAASKEPSPTSQVYINRKKEDDFGNIVLLIVLCKWLQIKWNSCVETNTSSLDLIQGVPIGLALGSVPYILKSMDNSRLTYSDIAIFSIASYPYSLKLLWSPIVDSYYSRSFGRRKSWIVPIQTLLGISLIVLGQYSASLFDPANINIGLLTAIFTGIILLASTQDIAVDGWALTILSKENVKYASTCQTIGLNTGYFLSFTVFLALSSADFWQVDFHLLTSQNSNDNLTNSNKYLRSVPVKDVGLITMKSYLTFWGAVCIMLTAFLILFKNETRRRSEEDDDEPKGIVETYRVIWKICKLECVRSLVLLLALSKIGTTASEVLSPLKLLDLGFQKEDLALAVLLDFPLQILFGYLVARWTSKEKPLNPWSQALLLRLGIAGVTIMMVKMFPSKYMIERERDHHHYHPSIVEGLETVPFWYYVLVILVTISTSFVSNVMFVSQGAFFAMIGDPKIGGTYMTVSLSTD